MSFEISVGGMSAATPNVLFIGERVELYPVMGSVPCEIAVINPDSCTSTRAERRSAGSGVLLEVRKIGTTTLFGTVEPGRKVARNRYEMTGHRN